MKISDWMSFHPFILQLEEEGFVTRTYRRLDPMRQQTILLAILEEAAQYGPASLNVKRVADRADISVGSLYQYFNNRDGMLNFAVELCVRYIKETFDQYRSYLAALPLRQGLEAYLTGGVEWGRAQTGLLSLFARAAYQGDPELAERLVIPVATTLREMVSDILRQAIARGEIRANVDLEVTTRLVHALMIAVGDSQLLPYLNNYFQVEDPALKADQTMEGLLDMIVHGIGENKP